MKIRICFLLVMFCLVSFYQLHAQDISIGVKGGISIPNLTAPGGVKNPLSTGFSSRLGPDAAMFAEIPISDLFSVQPMIEYSTQGGKKNGYQAFPTPAEAAVLFPAGQAPAYLYGNFKNDVELNYLMLPILAKFGLNIGQSPFRVYADLGPFASLLLSAKNKTSGSSMIYTDAAGAQPLPVGTFPFNNSMDVKSNLHKGNAGIEGHLGFSYSIGKSTVFIEGGGNYGFINIQKDATDGKNNTGAAVIMAGYSFRF